MTYLAQTGSTGNEVDFGTATLPGYNIANQRLLVLYPATGESGSGRASMTMGYQYPGGPQTFVRHYDEGNNAAPVRETDTTYGPEGETLTVSGSTEPVAYTYDLLYRPLTTTDGNGDTTTYFYNTQGYLLLRRLAVIGLTTRTDLDASFLQIVAEYKAAPGPTALRDCFGLALAQREGLPFVTSDRHELTRVAARNRHRRIYPVNVRGS